MKKRVAALTEELEKCCLIRWTDTPAMGDQMYAGLSLDAAGLIEQALLAERRLAKLEDAEFVAEYHSKESAYYNNSPSVYMQAQCRDIAKALRAAAENEVSAPNAECPLHGSLSVQRRVKMQAEGKPIPCTCVATPRGGE